MPYAQMADSGRIGVTGMPPALDDLVRGDRVRRSVYTDPETFQLERERIFNRVWLFVGHESQAPQAGDFFTAEVATTRKPIVRPF